jgi:hypothetical protein
MHYVKRYMFIQMLQQYYIPSALSVAWPLGALHMRSINECCAKLSMRSTLPHDIAVFHNNYRIIVV